jgi:hypothetical protein
MYSCVRHLLDEEASRNQKVVGLVERKYSSKIMRTKHSRLQGFPSTRYGTMSSTTHCSAKTGAQQREKQRYEGNKRGVWWWEIYQSLLKHQASCRARGYTDPVGYGMLSKSMTKNNRKLAWREEEEAAVSLSCLFFEYYMTSIHPYLNKPAVVMSKMLRCECD